MVELNVLAAHTESAQRAYWIGGNANITGEVRRKCKMRSKTPFFQSMNWLWSDGTPMNLTNWIKGEPNNRGGYEFCMEMMGPWLSGGGYEWHESNLKGEFALVHLSGSVSGTTSRAGRRSRSSASDNARAASDFR